MGRPWGSPRGGAGLRNRDSAERAYRIKALVWSIPGAFIGLLAGVLVASRTGVNSTLAVLLGAAIGASATYGSVRVLTRAAVSAMQAVHAPSGASTPIKRDYSLAQSLVARGRYGDAVAAYQSHAVEFPDDPVPPLQLARLLGGHLRCHEEAAAWLRHARAHCTLTTGQELMVAQELVRIYVDELQAPRRAMPELSRIVAGFPETPAAATARRELEAMRELLVQEHDGLVDFTAAYLERARDEPGGPSDH